MSNYVTISEAETKRYILLQPGHYPPRSGPTYCQLATWEDVPEIIELANQSDILAVDFETKGGDYSDAIEIIGVGLSYAGGSAYLHWSDLYLSNRRRIAQLLLEHPGLIAHNVYFDGGVLRAVTGRHANWHACTYSLLAHLANEGHPDQYWGLKGAQIELLGWKDSNEHELNEWLVANGHYRGNRRINTDPEYLINEYQAGKLPPERGEMWRAPREILGKYCVLDAESCYLLYTRVLAPVAADFPDLMEYFHRDVMHLIRLLIDQRLVGIPVNKSGLEARMSYLEYGIAELEDKFRSHPLVAPHLLTIEKQLLDEFMATEPEQYLKRKETKEPARFRKDGTESINWVKWKERQDAPPVISKNWLRWHERYQGIMRGQEPDYRFNLQSGRQLQDLLYVRMGYEVRVPNDTGAEKKKLDESYELPPSEASTGVKALKHMGEVGNILIERNYAVKELGYIEDYLARTENRATIHPSFRTPGTMTGRLSSKEPNVQQIPKSKAVMSLFTARPGHVWIDLDFSALEPVVLTEFSQDENLLRIYGNAAPNNDIYLFVAAGIPTYRDEILRTGYDPYNPTPESLARAKKECKGTRSICKTVVLACQYGAGVNKIQQTLEQDNVFLNYDEVAEIHRGYWDLFSGVKEYSNKLFHQWKRNGGWILNGMGRPMCVPEEMKKDMLNRFVQSTGHDILVKYIQILTDHLGSMPWTPVIIDWHDACAIEVPEEWKERAVTAMNWAVDELNRQLGGTIKLRGEPDIGYNLAEIKKPES